MLVHWPGFFAMGGVALPAADPGDLAGSFWRQAVAIDGLCADGPRLACEFTGPDGFRGDLGTAVGLYCTDRKSTRLTPVTMLSRMPSSA